MTTAVEQLNEDLARFMGMVREFTPVLDKANTAFAKLRELSFMEGFFSKPDANRADQVLHEFYTRETFIKFLSSCNIEVGIAATKEAIIENISEVSNKFNQLIVEAIYPIEKIEKAHEYAVTTKEKHLGEDAIVEKNWFGMDLQ